MSEGNLAFGLVGALVAVVCFGTYAVPVSLAPTGDGVFFQWIQCSAILVIGYIAQLAFGATGVPLEQVVNVHNITVNCTMLPYQFEPIAMVGGMLWTIGNCTVVPIIGLIGLGLGLLLWGLANMVVGWSIGVAGIEPYIAAGKVNTPALNYAGLAVAVASFVLYFFVKGACHSCCFRCLIMCSKSSECQIHRKSLHLFQSQVEKKPVVAKDAIATDATHDEQLPLVSGARSMVQNNNWGDDDASIRSPLMAAPQKAPMSDLNKKLLGGVLACFAGLCYGFNMAPVIYLSQKYPCAGPFAFAFSHFSGIFLTSTFIMAVYAIVKKNQPYIEPRSVLGGLGGGCLWGLAQCAWFAANVNLGPAIAFPIITTGPALVGNLWGVFYFKEIRGRNNLLKLMGAFAVTIIGIILIALSKVDFGGSSSS